MKKAILAILPLLAGCSADSVSTEPTEPTAVLQTARIDHPAITEASGLALSTLRDDRLWVINDGGSGPVLHAIGIDGEAQGSIRLEPGANFDWEAIASFELDGRSWLLVADAGDNNAARETSTIYVIEEPALAGNEDVVVAPDRTFSFRWPEGPQDCEAVAVDAASERILLLAKRAIPAVLYELPLRPANADVLTATRLGLVDAIPQPSADDLERAAPARNWHWQPTAMDIARNGGAAVILTYRAVYYFERSGNEPWIEALRNPPRAVDLGGIREAEAIAFVDGGRGVLVTVEAPRPPLYRIRGLP